MYRVVRERMIEAAEREELVYYGELMNIANLHRENSEDRAFLGEMLAEINDEEVEKGNPPLSVVAVNGGERDHKPSCGFFAYIDEREIRIPGEDDLEAFSRLFKEATNTKWN